MSAELLPMQVERVGSLWKTYPESGLILFPSVLSSGIMLVAYTFLEKKDDFCIHIVTLCVEYTENVLI